MINWLKLTAEERNDILGLVSRRTGLPAYAIEKDWWVILALYTIFRTEWKDNIVFKGGTSLSKSWDLIERFSEDIDLVIDRSVLGFGEELSKSKVKELRKAFCAFTSGIFRDTLENELLIIGVPKDMFKLKVADTTESDRDPQILELYYISSLEKGTYLKEAVLIEIGARSLREPSEQRVVNSIISETLSDTKTSGEPFSILTVTLSALSWKKYSCYMKNSASRPKRYGQTVCRGIFMTSTVLWIPSTVSKPLRILIYMILSLITAQSLM